MRPVTPQFLTAVRGSHPMAVRVRVIPEFTTGANPDGDEIPVFDGLVQFDATADIRGILDLTTDGTGWDPRPGQHPLQTYGDEVFVERGVGFGGSQVEWVPLGYFRLYDIEQQQPPDGPLRIVGRDRMSVLVDAQLTTPRQFPVTQSVSGVFAALVREVLPDAVIEFDDDIGAAPLERAQIADQDRHGFLRDLAAAHGKTMYFDHRGVLVVKSPPPTTEPVFDVDAGKGGVLIEAARSISRDGVFNGVVVEGEAPDGDSDPVRVLAYDANPDSPTFWQGRFGQVPTFFTSSLITRVQQCASAARAILERSLGTPYNVDLSAVPNPALEPFDPVRVKYGDTAGREVHIIDTLYIPLTAAGAMTGTTREQTAVLISTEGD